MRHVAQLHRDRWIDHALVAVGDAAANFRSPPTRSANSGMRHCGTKRRTRRRPTLRAANRCRLARRRAPTRDLRSGRNFAPRCRRPSDRALRNRCPPRPSLSTVRGIVDRPQARRTSGCGFSVRGPPSPRRNRRRRPRRSHARRRASAPCRQNFFPMWECVRPTWPRQALGPHVGMFLDMLVDADECLVAINDFLSCKYDCQLNRGRPDERQEPCCPRCRFSRHDG